MNIGPDTFNNLAIFSFIFSIIKFVVFVWLVFYVLNNWRRYFGENMEYTNDRHDTEKNLTAKNE